MDLESMDKKEPMLTEAARRALSDHGAALLYLTAESMSRFAEVANAKRVIVREVIEVCGPIWGTLAWKVFAHEPGLGVVLDTSNVIVSVPALCLYEERDRTEVSLDPGTMSIQRIEDFIRDLLELAQAHIAGNRLRRGVEFALEASLLTAVANTIGTLRSRIRGGK